jgi:hypothetical protein
MKDIVRNVEPGMGKLTNGMVLNINGTETLVKAFQSPLQVICLKLLTIVDFFDTRLLPYLYL